MAHGYIELIKALPGSVFESRFAILSEFLSPIGFYKLSKDDPSFVSQWRLVTATSMCFE
jgi:hypothetical protein